MTQHIDLSLVGRVRDRGVRGGREGGGGYNGAYNGGGEGEWNKIHAVRQIYALLGFLNVCSFA